MLLTNIKHPELKTQNFQVFSIKECVKYALSYYPLTDRQRQKIHWKPDENPDFSVQGSEILVVHILYNLLRNALYFIEKAEKGHILIWIEQKSEQHILHFKDTENRHP